MELLVWMLGGPSTPAVLCESLAPPEVPQIARQGGLTERLSVAVYRVHKVLDQVRNPPFPLPIAREQPAGPLCG